MEIHPSLLLPLSRSNLYSVFCLSTQLVAQEFILLSKQQYTCIVCLFTKVGQPSHPAEKILFMAVMLTIMTQSHHV